MTDSPFDHLPDEKLGKVLKATLSGADEEGFVRRVLDRAAEIGAPAGEQWWEVLSSWARPVLAAAAVGAAAALALWMSGAVDRPQSPPLGDPLTPLAEAEVPEALLSSAEPPDLDYLLVVGWASEERR